MDYDAYDALLHHIFKKVSVPVLLHGRCSGAQPRQTQGDAWFKPSEENISAGVCLRVEPGQFRVFPYENPFLAPFEAAIRTLNPVVAVKVRSAAVHAALATVCVFYSHCHFGDSRVLSAQLYRSDDATAIYVDHNTRIQILDSMAALPTAEKEQCGAFIVKFSSLDIAWENSDVISYT